uniref:Transmembrane protein 41A n=1 Tax=Panagrolaimus sp. ES5 TaxID=591445 RepID=A0AC34G1Y5_9BILA
MPLVSKRVLVVGTVITLYATVLFTIYRNFPELDADEKQHIKYPRNLDDAKALGKVLSKYKDEHYYTVLIGVGACSASGAAVCYCLSYLVGRKLVASYFPERVEQWQKEVQKHQENLFNYMVVLRVTPVLPNWFINIAAPVIDVSLAPFFWGTFFGVAPPSMLFIQAGTTLQEMVNANMMWSWKSIIMIIGTTIIAILPVLYRKYSKPKTD